MSDDGSPLTGLSSCVLCGYELRDRRMVRRLNGTRFVVHPECAREGLEGVGLDSPHAVPDEVGRGEQGSEDPEEELVVREEPSEERVRPTGMTRLDDFT